MGTANSAHCLLPLACYARFHTYLARGQNVGGGRARSPVFWARYPRRKRRVECIFESISFKLFLALAFSKKGVIICFDRKTGLPKLPSGSSAARFLPPSSLGILLLLLSSSVRFVQRALNFYGPVETFVRSDRLAHSASLPTAASTPHVSLKIILTQT